mmetsp:Transcript_84970/g.203667  ORF Transcript_84970/g.203667 Transcript_84970/m.203667 type:complete len:253 (-) Transcript_84970:184-942(-)
MASKVLFARPCSWPAARDSPAKGSRSASASLVAGSIARREALVTLLALLALEPSAAPSEMLASRVFITSWAESVQPSTVAKTGDMASSSFLAAGSSPMVSNAWSATPIAWWRPSASFSNLGNTVCRSSLAVSTKAAALFSAIWTLALTSAMAPAAVEFTSRTSSPRTSKVSFTFPAPASKTSSATSLAPSTAPSTTSLPASIVLLTASWAPLMMSPMLPKGGRLGKSFFCCSATWASGCGASFFSSLVATGI